jgi:hypothetical protein
LLFLYTNITVAFWAEIHGCWTTEETTVVCAETVTFRSLTWLFFRHGSERIFFLFLFLRKWKFAWNQRILCT